MPYGRHDTTFDICVGMFVGALVFFEENGFVSWYDYVFMKPFNSFIYVVWG
jgi:hypothetical protein